MATGAEPANKLGMKASFGVCMSVCVSPCLSLPELLNAVFICMSACLSVCPCLLACQCPLLLWLWTVYVPSSPAIDTNGCYSLDNPDPSLLCELHGVVPSARVWCMPLPALHSTAGKGTPPNPCRWGHVAHRYKDGPANMASTQLPS